MNKNEHELILIPRLEKLVVDGTKLKNDLESLTRDINSKGGLKIDISIDTNQIKAIEKRVSDLKAVLSKVDSVGLGDFGGVEVSTKKISAVTAEKLKLDLANKQVLHTEKLIGLQEDNNHKREVHNIKLRALLAAEELKAKKAANAENNKASSMNQSMEKTQLNLQNLSARLEDMKRRWSAMLSDPELMSQWDALNTKVNSAFNIKTPQDAKNAYQQLNSEVSLFSKNVSIAGKNQKSLGDVAMETGRRLMAYFTSLVSMASIIGSIKSAFQAVKDIDLSLTELRKVSDLTGESLDRFVKRAFDAGNEIGRTGKDVLDASSTFKRAGYNIESSFDMAKAALVMTNVGDNIKDVEYASSSLIAVLRGFKMSESDVMGIVDAINQVSNTAPIAFQDLTEGLRRVSGVMAQTGTDFSKTIGLLTGGFAQLRDIEGVSAGKQEAPYVQKCA